jgi:transcription antitermination protein NusB
MGARRKARELALKALFEHDFNQQSLGSVGDRLITENGLETEVSSFLLEIISHFVENNEKIDKMIEGHSSHWKLSRMASVDRNILRLGVCELLYFSDVPKNVTINEYLEIAKKFGNEESSSFVNGILDKIIKP